MPEDKSVELLMKVLEKRDEAKKYMEKYKDIMNECDGMILELKDN